MPTAGAHALERALAAEGPAIFGAALYRPRYRFVEHGGFDPKR
jgi:hypothetical protein